MNIGHLAELCYEISNKTKADIFFRYTPVTNEISISVCVDGWTEDVEFEYIEVEPLLNGELKSLSFRAEQKYIMEAYRKLLEIYQKQLEVLSSE